MKKKLHIKAHAKDRVIHRNKKSVVYRDDDTAASVVASFFTGIGIALSFIGGALVAIIVTVCIVSLSYLQIVANAAGTTVPSLVAEVNKGWNETVIAEQGNTNLLILGVDTLENRDESGVMTDTIMVLSLDPEKGNVNTFSIPRDLYLPSQRTKINAVYALANQQGDAKPHLATKQVVETLTGLPIHHVMVLEIGKLGQLIDALGGLDIEVERSFTDAQFPRSDVDVRVERDPAKLYESISFTKGTEHMNGKRALQFVRSRHSTDPIEGTDDARVKRQQKVIAALINRLEDRNLVKNPSYIGFLIKLYRDEFDRFLPFSQLIALGREFVSHKQMPHLQSHSLPVQGVDKDPVIYHPTRHSSGAWVYLLTDSSGKALKDLIQSWIQ